MLKHVHMIPLRWIIVVYSSFINSDHAWKKTLLFMPRKQQAFHMCKGSRLQLQRNPSSLLLHFKLRKIVYWVAPL